MNSEQFQTKASSSIINKLQFLSILVLALLSTLNISSSNRDACTYGRTNTTGSLTCRTPPVKDCGSSAISGRWITELSESEAEQRLMTYVENIAWKEMNEADSLMISQIRCDRDEYMPVYCRLFRDLCNESFTSDPRWGNNSWPLTDVGTRRYVLCQYSYSWEALYASYDCLIDYSANNTPSWFLHDDSNCPMPQLHREIEEMYINLTSHTMVLQDDSSCNNMLGNMAGIMMTRNRNPVDPVFSVDHERLVDTCFMWANSCWVKGWGRGEQETVLWNISDFLLDYTEFYKYWKNEDEYLKFNYYLTLLFPDQNFLQFSGRNVYSYSSRLDYKLNTFNTDFVDTPGIKVSINVTAGQNLHVSETRLFVVKDLLYTEHNPIRVYGDIPLPLNSLSSSSPRAPAVTANNGRTPGFSLSSISTFGTPEPGGTPPYTPSTPSSGTRGAVRRKRRNLEDLRDEDTLHTASTISSTNLKSNLSGQLLNNNINDSPQVLNMGGWSSLSGFDSTLLPLYPSATGAIIQATGWFTFLGPLMYIETREELGGGDHTVNNINTIFNVQIQHPDFKKIDASKLVALRTLRQELRSKRWFTDGCLVTNRVDDIVTFTCTQPGFYTVVYYNPTGNTGVPGGTTTAAAHTEGTPSPTPGTDLSVFLGFVYNYELYMTGIVLRAVSLLCLVITVLSYIIFKKARRGIPTEILLHLCISLIILNVVLYLAEVWAGKRTGCIVFNVLRYYFVLVSLLWNGIEAHNMYRMLVKVFNSNDTSHFVLKSAIIAWGLPAAAVGIAFAASVTVFDGTYYNCIFRCSLRKAMLYYGWLIPMGLIMIHNLAIFVLVMNVLCRRKSIQSSSTTLRRSAWTNLSGALTMLVLLGVPWMFSAFGVIDAGDNRSLSTLEGVFNGIFVVCISLQGLFIFWFHCARVSGVREQWRSALVDHTPFFSLMHNIDHKTGLKQRKEPTDIINEKITSDTNVHSN